MERSTFTRKHDKSAADRATRLDIVFYVNCDECRSRHMSGDKEYLLSCLLGKCPTCDSSLMEKMCVAFSRKQNRVLNCYVMKHMYNRRAYDDVVTVSMVEPEVDEILGWAVIGACDSDGGFSQSSLFAMPSEDDIEDAFAEALEARKRKNQKQFQNKVAKVTK